MYPSSHNAGFREIKEFREGEVVATITEREATGHRSFKIGKQFTKQGELKYSSFLSPQHLDAALVVLGKIREFLDADKQG
jgi:hypothetical protein